MRYTRQALKQDRFKETAAEAVDWTVEHRSKLVTGGVVLAIVVAIVAGAYWYNSSRNEKAADLLGHALMVYQAPVRPAGMPADPQQLSFTSLRERGVAAGIEFNKIAAEYGSTRSGKYAKYFAGLAALDAGNQKAAEDHLKYVAGVRDKDIASMAKLALAALYRDTNRPTDAINLYKDLISHPTQSVPQVMAQLQLADLYSASEPNQAKAIYQQILKDSPQRAAAEIAQGKMQQLK
ncbi:MAG TPA: tetratricopeptide repeat protein [Terriglobales bacterium]|nr:tetratricopeptide repeat protein [Terriglobales bacterium]